MLTLVTGVPGTGKTLWTINHLSDIKDRPIYYHGIPDLSDILGWIPLSDPANFHNEIPDGAIVVIDEVQKVFRQRPPRNPVPDALEFCETHRHHGVDIYFITQRPTFLDHHARHLAGRHLHLHRNFGVQQAVLYDFNRYTDTEDKRNLQDGTKSTFRYPTKTYDLYKSAEVHTHKRRLPKRLLLIPLGFGFVGLLIWFGIDTLWGDKGSSLQTSSPLAQLPANVQPTSEYWQKALTPVIQGLPFTAPLYQKIASNPKTMPMVKGCISSADNARCSCYTQQGTRIQMEIAQCLHFVENPYFDMYKESDQGRDRGRDRHRDRRRSNNTDQVAQKNPNLNIESGISVKQIPAYGGYQFNMPKT